MAHAVVSELRLFAHIRYLFCLLLVVGQACWCAAQTPLDTVVSRLQAWEHQHRPERVHIHTDKPYYLVGDTIWLKAYTVIGADHQLSGWSGAVYVDLISETDSLVAALKLPLMAGLAKGNIDLPNHLRPGNYRLRAYTQWMRNAGSDYFFDQLVPVGTMSAGSIQARVNYEYQPDEKEVITTISYIDEQNTPPVGSPVRYVVKSSQEQIRVGNERTGADGSISLAFKPKAGYDTLTMYIEATITAGDRKQIHKFPIKSTFSDFDVQFFPEGGYGVAGLRSRIAFKAIGTDGLGLDIKGEILNSQGEVVAQLESAHAGMGVLSLVQEPGQAYKARINLPDGSTKEVALPEAASSGYVLSAYAQRDLGEILIRLQATEDRYGPVSLVLHRQGQVYYADNLSLDAPMTVMRLPVRDISSGIVQLTLLDGMGEPVNERVLFIENADTLQFDGSDWSMQADARALTALQWRATDSTGNPLLANFSVAVTNEDAMPMSAESEATIFSQLLLRSALKGYIEKPNYYFHEVTDEKRDHLDLLMMTQGFRRFRWEELTGANRTAELPYPVEKMVSSISGKLLFLRNQKPVPNGQITLFSINADVALDTVTNEEGEFVFDNLMLTDSIKFTVQGRTAKGGDKVEVVLDALPGMPVSATKNRADLLLDVPAAVTTYTRRATTSDSLLQTLGLESRIIHLDEVTVTATGRPRFPRSSNMNGPGNADQVLTGNELTACLTLRACLEGRLAGVVFRTVHTNFGPMGAPHSTRGGAMLVVVDGWMMDPNSESGQSDIGGIFEQGMLDASQIVSIEVLRSPSLTTVYGRGGQNGVIIITTHGWRPGTVPNYSTKFYAPKGFSNVREFYSPKYGVSKLFDAIADRRTTVYWNPDVSTDVSGSASFQFFNTAVPGRYRVVIEGIGAGGQLGRKVFHYQVD